MIEKVDVDVCTDIEQSKRLIKLGVPKSAADKVILDRILGNDISVMDRNSLMSEDLFEGEERTRAIPAWSIDALYKLLKTLLEEKAERDSYLGLAENKCD